MAHMIPGKDPATIENDGERIFYEACLKLSDNYSVLHSFSYVDDGYSGEADFVIVHPGLGYLVVEVKGGNISCHSGEWCRQISQNDYKLLDKNPVDQAMKAMYYILRCYKEAARSESFPLSIKYAVAFPEASKMTGTLPANLSENSVFLFHDLDNLERKIISVFGEFNQQNQEKRKQAVKLLIDKVLAPSCTFFTGLEDRIKMFYQQAEFRLTEEQEHILEATALNTKMLFLGAAGTGKKFIALEKAKKLCRDNKKVFLTCFNKNLAYYLQKKLNDFPLVVQNFHDYILAVLQEQDSSFAPPVDNAALSTFYNDTLPEKAFEYYESKKEEDKFDAIIVDEGQDFQDHWLTCLESMCKEEHEFYVFADPNQDIFCTNIEDIKKLEIYKHRLTGNLRNTEEINTWMRAMMPTAPEKSLLNFRGLPVQLFPWKTPQEEKRLIEKEVGRLVSQGIHPHRIVLLSPNRIDKSCLAGLQKIKEWPLGDYDDHRSNTVRFSTIRSFKGLEADIVFLIGLHPDTRACTKGDIYVGGSRARFLLYIFHRDDIDPGWIG